MAIINWSMDEGVKINIHSNNAAMGHVKALAFRRKAGTEGEINAINYIQKTLEKEGIDSSKESFSWASGNVVRLILAFFFLYMVFCEIFLCMYSYIWFILILNILLIIIIIRVILPLLDWTKIIYFGKKIKSSNIVAKLEGSEMKNGNPVIIFCAHHDTISRRYPQQLYVLFLRIGILTGLIYVASNLTLSSWSLLKLLNMIPTTQVFNFFNLFTIWLGIGFEILIILILLNSRKNNSIGALDNASGVAILLELTKLFHQNPLKKMDLIFLWCAAEEVGLWGSKQYCAEHFEQLINEYDMDKSIVLNFDVIGSYIGLLDKIGLVTKKRMNDNLNDIILAIAKQKNIPITREDRPLGATGDHSSFQKSARTSNKTLQTGCFMSDKDSKYIHSSKDTPDRCSAEILNECIELCYDTVKSIEKRLD